MSEMELQQCGIRRFCVESTQSASLPLLHMHALAAYEATAALLPLPAATAASIVDVRVFPRFGC